jgi:hypothetical protein
MTSPAMILTPAPDGWSISLTTGVELEHFRGLWARWRAERRLAALVGRLGG